MYKDDLLSELMAPEFVYRCLIIETPEKEKVYVPFIDDRFISVIRRGKYSYKEALYKINAAAFNQFDHFSDIEKSYEQSEILINALKKTDDAIKKLNTESKAGGKYKINGIVNCPKSMYSQRHNFLDKCLCHID
ncbi:MAG: hypothetical protein ABIG84_03105 [archaeon]